MRSATAHVALQTSHNVGWAWIWICFQQSDAAHDHSRGAVGALKRSCIEKRLLHRMQFAILLETFDGGDRPARSGTYRNLAGATRRATKQDGARAALPFTAAILSASKSQFIAKHIKQRRIAGVLHRVALAVYFKL